MNAISTIALTEASERGSGKNVGAVMRLLIASSTAGKDGDIVPTLIEHIGTNFQAVAWDNAFTAGQYPLEALLEQANQFELALFVFSADDQRKYRGRNALPARDIVVLEYGLFTAVLGRSRVAIIQEEGVELPVDIDGTCVLRFPSAPGPLRDAKLKSAAKDLAQRWQKPLPPPRGRFVDATRGFPSKPQLAAVARPVSHRSAPRQRACGLESTAVSTRSTAAGL